MRWALLQRPRAQARAPPHPGSPGPAGAGFARSAAGPFWPSAFTLRVRGTVRAPRLPWPETPGCTAGRPLRYSPAPKAANWPRADGAEFAQMRGTPREKGPRCARGRHSRLGAWVWGRPAPTISSAGELRRARGTWFQTAGPRQPDGSRGPAVAVDAKVPPRAAQPTGQQGAGQRRPGAHRRWGTRREGGREERRLRGGQRPGRLSLRWPGACRRCSRGCCWLSTKQRHLEAAAEKLHDWGQESPSSARSRLALSPRPAAGRGTGLDGDSRGQSRFYSQV